MSASRSISESTASIPSGAESHSGEFASGTSLAPSAADFISTSTQLPDFFRPSPNGDARDRLGNAGFPSNHHRRLKRASISSVRDKADATLVDLLRHPRRSSDSVARSRSNTAPVSDNSVSNQLLVSIHLVRDFYEASGIGDSVSASSGISIENVDESEVDEISLEENEENVDESEVDEISLEENEPVQAMEDIVADEAEEENALDFWADAELEPIVHDEESLGESSDLHLIGCLAQGDHR